MDHLFLVVAHWLSQHPQTVACWMVVLTVMMVVAAL